LGTFYRVGADPAWPPLADGMVAMFRFGNGFCDFRSRYVRTPRFVAERAARRSLFGAYRNPFSDDLSVAGLSRGLANTNVYWHGGRLLASKEDSPLPFHYRHPVTGKDFVPDSWGAFPA
jgi:carotenoid cleavage dioxygenase